MVGTSRLTPCFSHTSSSVGTNAGSSRRGTTMPSSASWKALEYHVASVAMTRPSTPSDANARRKPRNSSTRPGGRQENGERAAGLGDGAGSLAGLTQGAASARSMPDDVERPRRDLRRCRPLRPASSRSPPTRGSSRVRARRATPSHHCVSLKLRTTFARTARWHRAPNRQR
jgi:hypothetical protein